MTTPTMTDTLIGSRLRAIRESRQIKQSEAAAALGVDATAISKIETGTRQLSAIELGKLANLYQISASFVLGSWFDTGKPSAPALRRFRLVRHVDTVGVSGTGVIALGVQLPDLRMVLAWQTPVLEHIHFNAITFYHAERHLRAIHCHDGLTTIEWIDDEVKP